MMQYWMRFITLALLWVCGGTIQGQTTDQKPSKPLPRLWFFTDSGKKTFGEYIEKLTPIETPRADLLWIEPPRVDFSLIPPLTPSFTEKVDRWWLIPLILGVASTALFLNDGGNPIPPGVPPDIPVTPVPEPATVWLFAVGVVVLTIWMYRRKLKASPTRRENEYVSRQVHD